MPARYWEFSGEEFNIAVSPQKLESLQLTLEKVQRETATVRASLEEDLQVTSELAEQVEVSRLRLRDLREEEAAACSAPVPVETDTQVQEEKAHMDILVYRTETEALAQEVAEAAQLQLARSSHLGDLRIAARLARFKRGCQAADKVCDDFNAERRCQREELENVAEVNNALRVRTEELRCEVQETVERELEETSASSAREVSQHEELAALRTEFTEAVEARQTASLALAAQHQAQAGRRSHMTEISSRLAGARVATQRLARSLQDVGNERSTLQAKLTELRCGSAAVKVDAHTHNAACALLEAELRQQRDATLSWQACADSLAQGHIDISAETARVVSSSRKALCSRSVGLVA